MRIDKFLWCVRVYKTRSLAAEEIKKNRIAIGDQTVKSSKDVNPGDVIKIRKNQIDYKIKVLDLPKSRVGAKLVSLYIVDRTEPEQLAILQQRKLTQEHYRLKGEGRPTKKDRRAMEDFMEGDDAASSTDWDSFFSPSEEASEKD